MATVVRLAGKEVKIEVAPEGERERPGDIWIPGFKDGKPVAIDFAITTAADPCAADRIAHTKTQKYKVMCERLGWAFKPVVGDGFGAVRGEGAAFLNALAKMLTEKVGKGWPAPSTLMWRTVSTCLMRRRAEAIVEAWGLGLTSTDLEGHPPDDPGDTGAMDEDYEEAEDEDEDNLDGTGNSNAQPCHQAASTSPLWTQ